MKLYLKDKDEDGDLEYLEVSFWSFLKCHLISNLALVGLFYGSLIILFIVWGIIDIIIDIIIYGVV